MKCPKKAQGVETKKIAEDKIKKMKKRGSNPPVEVEDGVERSRVPVINNFTIFIIIVVAIVVNYIRKG